MFIDLFKKYNYMEEISIKELQEIVENSDYILTGNISKLPLKGFALKIKIAKTKRKRRFFNGKKYYAFKIVPNVDNMLKENKTEEICSFLQFINKKKSTMFVSPEGIFEKGGMILKIRRTDIEERIFKAIYDKKHPKECEKKVKKFTFSSFI